MPLPPLPANNDFEKSVTGLEADLRRLPGAKPLSQVERSSRNTFASDCDSEIINRLEMSSMLKYHHSPVKFHQKRFRLFSMVFKIIIL